MFNQQNTYMEEREERWWERDQEQGVEVKVTRKYHCEITLRCLLLRRFESSRRSLRNICTRYCKLLVGHQQVREISLVELFIFTSKDISVENWKHWHSRFLSANDATSSDSMFSVPTAGKFIHFNKWLPQQGAILPVCSRQRKGRVWTCLKTDIICSLHVRSQKICYFAKQSVHRHRRKTVQTSPPLWLFYHFRFVTGKI